APARRRLPRASRSDRRRGRADARTRTGRRGSAGREPRPVGYFFVLPLEPLEPPELCEPPPAGIAYFEGDVGTTGFDSLRSRSIRLFHWPGFSTTAAAWPSFLLSPNSGRKPTWMWLL